MKSSDLTVIYLTCNKMPARWVEFHREHLLRAVEGFSLICVSAEPLLPPWGRPDTQFLIQEPPFGAWNVYAQILRAARIADTNYVAVAEDDTLYPRRHFTDFRPKYDEIAYDMSRWSVFSWKGEKAFFSAIRRHGNFTMIGQRELVIDALEERERKHPNAKGSDYAGEIGRPDVERKLGVTRRRLVEWYCIEPMVNLCHPQGLSPTYVHTRGLERKPGELKAYDIPIWGKAADIAAVYNEGVSREDAGVS